MGHLLYKFQKPSWGLKCTNALDMPTPCLIHHIRMLDTCRSAAILSQFTPAYLTTSSSSIWSSSGSHLEVLMAGCAAFFQNSLQLSGLRWHSNYIQTHTGAFSSRLSKSEWSSRVWQQQNTKQRRQTNWILFNGKPSIVMPSTENFAVTLIFDLLTSKCNQFIRP